MIYIHLIFLFFVYGLEAVDKPLRAGMELSYPPFEMVCNDGKPCGISVDIVEHLGHYLEKPIVIENISFIGLIPSLKNGIVDLVISSLTVTEQRAKAIDFSEPYAKIGLALLVSKKSDLESIEQANSPKRVIVVKSGTSGELYAAKHLKEAVVRVLDKETTCVLEVVQGKADGFIYDQLSVFTNWKKNPQTTRALLTPFQQEYWAIGVKKGNRSLLNKINAFIQHFRSQGGFEKLGDQYLPEQKKAFQEMGVPFVF